MLVIVLALVGGITFLVIRKLRRDNTVTYDAYTTSIRTISNSLSYSGSMQLINSATYTADEKVLVRDVYVAAGDKVKKDDRLMRLANGKTLTAEFDGTVNAMGAAKDDEVEKDSTLVQVVDFENMQVSFRIGESDISQVTVGQEVRVTVASANATFDSKVNRECKDSKAFGCFNRTLFLVLQQRMRQHCGVCTCIVTVNVSALW